ncbi:MAG: endonuclease/exonuclease/phosphatase family protein [Gammaproteobacteria bacterium]|nr:endonuclease/exonuclease/phosphatase family protein [Gammaproteobacteria bacterium]NNM20695.1 endonuclease/exonuclease/phosphatase family protein [Gammaproteobacteria bacterium]
MNAVRGIFIAALILTGCAQPTVPDGDAGYAPVTIMTFNVENLFDTRDDPGKDDSTYLPLKTKQNDVHRARCNELPVERWRDQCLNYDWNNVALEIKLSAVARAILQANEGRGPDIVALQEVENINVLEQLRKGFLSTARYNKAVLVEGDDARGIDVAFLSRLPLVGEPVLHPVAHPDFDDRLKDTRGILEATFRLPDGSLLTGYAVHFPAPFHPRAMREQAYRRLHELRDSLPPGRPAFAAGDFNTTAAENTQFKMFTRLVLPSWELAHRNGCGGCPGTYYYPPNDSWSFLDLILWSRPQRGEKATWRIAPGSAQLVNKAPGQTSPAGTPQRFELPAGTGISDHWPLMVAIEKRR